jgi:hypothetical protein
VVYEEDFVFINNTGLCPNGCTVVPLSGRLNVQKISVHLQLLRQHPGAGAAAIDGWHRYVDKYT